MEQLQPEANVAEYPAAFRSIRGAKGFWSLLIFLAIMTHLTAFVLVDYVGILDEEPAPEVGSASAPAARAPEQADKISLAGYCRTILDEAMPAMKFAAPISCMILTATLFLAVVVSLTGRLGGAGGFLGAFFWSLLLLLLLIPWQRILTGLTIPGALYEGGLKDIKLAKNAWATIGDQSVQNILYYGRHVAYPAIALVVWLLVQLKFARGCKRLNFPPAVVVKGTADKQPASGK